MCVYKSQACSIKVLLMNQLKYVRIFGDVCQRQAAQEFHPACPRFHVPHRDFAQHQWMYQDFCSLQQSAQQSVRIAQVINPN